MKRLRGIILLIMVIILGGNTFTITAAEQPLMDKKICIDPGHGGSDPGAVNVTYDLYESSINLDVSYGLMLLLENSGAEVVLTRTDHTYKDNSDRYIFCNAEQADILISVHTNSVVDTTWDGAMALYFHPDTEDELLASTIYEVLYLALKDSAPDPENFTDFGLDWFASGVLLKSDMPGTMLEPLLMSNSFEAPLLVQPIFENFANSVFNPDCENYNCRRGEIASAIYLGILHYYEEFSTGKMHVENMEMWYQPKTKTGFVYTQVFIEDENGNPLPEVLVSVSILLPGGNEYYLQENTDLNGIALFKIRENGTGYYYSTITEVFKENWIYDKSANIFSNAELTIP